ncbi:MAG: RNA polymerase sigma factor [Planctomycetota bacterium]
MDPRELRRVIGAAKAGDPDGYSALLEAYAPRLYGYFLRATGRHHDAEDLLGEITLRLVRKLESYDERGRFDQWIFRIAANMVRDRIRRIKTAPSIVSLSGEDDSERALADRVAGGEPAVEAAMVADERNQKLQEALAKLDETTRQMVLLRHMGQMSFKDLAELFQCPLGTALARVHRGLRTLEELMGRENGTE